MKEQLTASTDLLLVVKGVTLRFGGIAALDAVSFDLRRGEILGLIGPNGAGKTSMFNCLSRLYPYSAGEIEFNGRALRDAPQHRMAGLGVGRTFQNLALFDSMTVLNNIKVGSHSIAGKGLVAQAFRLPGVKREESATEARAWELIRFLDLSDVAGRRVSDLPFGTRKRVEMARALAGSPKLLLLDEPAAGLNHEEVEDLGSLIRRVRDELGISVLLVEHHMQLVMGVSDRVVALNFGRVIATGTPAEIQEHPDVVEAYLGHSQ